MAQQEARGCSSATHTTTTFPCFSFFQLPVFPSYWTKVQYQRFSRFARRFISHRAVRLGGRAAKTPSFHAEISYEKARFDQGLGLYIASSKIKFALAAEDWNIGVLE